MSIESTIDYSSRDMGLPLMVDLDWAGDGFDDFFIDDDYAANRLRSAATATTNRIAGRFVRGR